MPHSERTTVQRHAERARYDAETIHAILDEGFVCHVGFVDGDRPYVIPTLYARSGDTLYLHGSPLSRMLACLATGAPLCITVTHLDGLVLARSAFNHSMNFRSVVALGHGRLVTDAGEKNTALRLLVEQAIPGRSADARGANQREIDATLVVAVEIDEASAKVRSGPPKDQAADRDLPVWAGVLPLALHALAPEADPDAPATMPVPDYLQHYRSLDPAE